MCPQNGESPVSSSVPLTEEAVPRKPEVPCTPQAAQSDLQQHSWLFAS